MLKKIRIVSALLFIAGLDFDFMPNRIQAQDNLLEKNIPDLPNIQSESRLIPIVSDRNMNVSR